MAVCKAVNSYDFSPLYRLWQYCSSRNVNGWNKHIESLPIIEKILTNSELNIEENWKISLSSMSLKTDMGHYNTIQFIEYLFAHISELRKKDFSIGYVKDIANKFGVEKKTHEFNKHQGEVKEGELFPDQKGTEEFPNRASKKLQIDSDKSFKKVVEKLCKRLNVLGSKTSAYTMLVELSKIKPGKTPTASAMLLRSIMEQLTKYHNAEPKQVLINLFNKEQDNVRYALRDSSTRYQDLSSVVHGDKPVTPMEIYAHMIALKVPLEYLIDILKIKKAN